MNSLSTMDFGVRHRLQPQTGAAFFLSAGQSVIIISPEREQVSDITCFARNNTHEYFSSGRTLDYNETIYLTTGQCLYSNESNPMLEIVRDDVKRHDYLLTPCSERMFEILIRKKYHPSCHGNLSKALQPFGISPEQIHSTFNAFMNVEFRPDGKLLILPPQSKAGDCIVFRACMDLIVGITACSSENTNNGSCKPIEYELIDAEN